MSCFSYEMRIMISKLGLGSLIVLLVSSLRSNTHNTLRSSCVENGIEVTSIAGDFLIPSNELLAYPTTEDMAKSVKDDNNNVFDWVIVALKSSSLDVVPKLIEPLVSPETRVLVIMNGLIEDDLIEMLREQQRLECKAVYGGMALICSNRLSPGVIDHSYAGKLVVGVAFSSDANNDGNRRWVESDKQAIMDLFEPVTPVPFEFEDNLLRGRWWKNCWNLPFSGIAVAMGGITTDRIVEDPSLRKLAYKVMDETIATANADLASHGFPDEDFLPEDTREKMMVFTDAMGPYKTSTMLDLHARKPMEVKYLFRTALDRANKLGVPVPHLETLVCQIEAFQRYHNLY
jgi:2-dehydropantoate 2-reductase